MADNDDIVQNIDVNVNDENIGDAFSKLKDAAQGAFDSLKDIFEKGDFGAGFEKLRASSAQAFEAIKEGGTQAFEAIKGVGTGAASELKSIFEGLGLSMGVVFAGVAAAVAAVVTSIGLAAKAAYNFVEAQSKVVTALGDLSDKTRTAITDISALETAYAHAGVSAGEFASGYSKLADVVEKTWDKIKKDTQNGADTIEQRAIAAKRASEQLNKLETDSSRSKLLQPEENPKPFIGEFTGQRNVPVPFDRTKEIAQELELRQAKLAVREAEKAENEARKNDIQQVTRGVESLIDGNQNALKSFNASAENIVKGVVAAAGQGSEALNKMGESFASVGSKAPEVKDVLNVLGQALLKIEDPALRSKVALEALGKSGQSFLSALDSGKMDQFIASVDKMGGAVDETDKKIANNFKNSITGLNQDLSNIATKVSSAFGPGITAAITSFDEFLVRNQTTIIKLAEAISSVLTPALKLLGGAFTAVTETMSAAFDIFTRMFGLIKNIATLDFKGVVSSAKDLVSTLKAIDDATSTNAEQRKRGLDKLAELRKKDFDESRKQTEDASRSKTDTRAELTPGEQQLREIEARESFQKRQIEAELARADERDRRNGIVPSNQKPAGPPPASPDSLVDRVSDFAGRFGDKSKELLDPTGPGVKAFSESVVETLKNILQGGSLSKKDDGGGVDFTGKESGDGKAETGTSTGILDAIKNTFDTLLGKVNELGASDKKVTDPSTTGIRGDAGDVLEELKTAAASAAEALNKLAVNANSDSGDSSEAVAAADGGHIRGPGTGTSDSIPAMLSDGEFVVRKSAVDKVGVDALNAINEGRLHFADGGEVERKKREEENKKRNEEERKRALERSQNITASEQHQAALFPGLVTAGLFTGGEGSGGGDQTPITIKAPKGTSKQWIEDYNEATQAEAERDPNFIPILYKALGGLVGNLPRFASGGKVRIGPELPRFADGGSISIVPRLPRFADGGSVSAEAGGGAGMSHLGTVDLTTNHGTVRVAVDTGGISQLRRAAVQRNMGSAPKSSWVR